MSEPAEVEPVIHLILCRGRDAEHSRERVRHFFEKNFLVKYDRVVIPPEKIVSVSHPDFWARLESGISENQRTLAGLLDELRDNGFRTLADLEGMRRGYDSKILHIATHLLDGFFGIDSRFYNLEEEAHDISDRLSGEVREHPGAFWLVEAYGETDTGHEANRLGAIRGFEVEPPES